MLRSELYQLEKFIADILNQEYSTDKLSHSKKVAVQLKSMKSLCADLKEKWLRELFSSAKEQVITRYIHYHQAGITQLSNQVSGQIPAMNLPVNQPSNLLLFYEQLLSELEQLLQFLKHNCYQYFDLDYKVSIYYGQQQYEKIVGFEQELNAYSGAAIDRPLVEAIVISVEETVAEALTSGISYRQIDHTLDVLRMVHQLLNVVNEPSTNSLALALYRQNLNSPHFYNWYQDYILQQIKQASGKSEQEAIVNNEIKAFSAIFVDPEKAFEQELPSIDQMFLPWLQEKTKDGGKNSQFLVKQNGSGRLPLNLSVPQFALFICIFYQAGCFAVTNVSKLTRFFTQNFTTKKQPHISFKSFRRAFYSLDQSAAAIVREYLQKMLNYLNKTYFP